MKTTFSFIISILFSTLIYSQTQTADNFKSTYGEWQLDSLIVRNINLPDTWIPYVKLVNNFDLEGRIYQTDNYQWDTISISWKHFGRSTNTYNEYGDRVYSVSTTYNDSHHFWDTSSNYSQIYDESHRLISWKADYWNPTNHSWDNGAKGDYELDEEGRILSFLMSVWNKTEMSWFSSYFYEIKYNIAGNDSVGLYYQWSFADDSLVLSYIDEISCDENGNDTLHIETLSDGMPDYMRKYRYNENGLRINETNYTWINTEWVPFARSEYTLDPYGNILLSMYFNWESSTQNWVPHRQEQNYYSPTFTVIDLVPDKTYQVYPNPANEYIVFELNGSVQSVTFMLFNLSGTLVLKRHIYNGCTLSVASLPKGNYIYQIRNGVKMFSGKLILE